MAELYADENFPFPVVQELQKLGHRVITLNDAGLANQAVSDEEILNLASQSGCAVLTLNRRHFILLHNQHADHAGIIVCTFDLDFLGQAHRIHAAMNQEKILRRKLIRINRP